MLTLIVGVVCTLAGGYGGYKYGASVERKAQAELAALAKSAQTVASTVEQSASKL